MPPTTLLDSVRADMLFIDEVVGAGEIAISDERGLNQSAQELAKLVRDTHVGGLLSGKAGVTHFHVGEERTRLRPLRDIVEHFGVKHEWLYPTHVQRDEALLDEAIALAREGAHVDFDIVNEDLATWLPRYEARGGPLDRLTISSDADSAAPDVYFEQICGLVVRHGQPLARVLPLVTSNPARVLKLERKGRLEEGCDADIVLLDKGTLDIRHVFARGTRVVADGEVVIRERFLRKSQRNVLLRGDRSAGSSGE